MLKRNSRRASQPATTTTPTTNEPKNPPPARGWNGKRHSTSTPSHTLPVLHSFIHSVSSTTSHHRHSPVLPSPVTGNIIQVSAATRDRGAKRVGVATKLRESCGEREILKQNCWSVLALSPAHTEEEDEMRRQSKH